MRTTLGWIAGIIAVGAAVGVAGLVWFGRDAEIAAITPPDPATFPSDVVEIGAQLAAIGDCVVCHTKPDGEPFAGGAALETPFGTVFSTNITPDPDTGIGAWSEAAFVRSMTMGFDRAGNHLYPVFPYDHFAKVTEDDLKAIYAYLMTQPAVSSVAPPDALGFPFNQRPLLAVWKLLYLDTSVWQPDPALDDEHNRGAYLVEGLGHCGSCHTPRTLLGGLDRARAFAGAEAENWHVPAIGAAAKGPAPWSLDAYANYLFDGWDAAHGLAAGPMGVVVDHLAEASEDDIFAMAAYLATLRAEPDKAELDAVVAGAGKLDWADGEAPGGANAPTTDMLLQGERVFAANCVKCHKARVAETQPVSLALSAVVNAPDPRNFVHVVRGGIVPPYASRQRSMPAQDRTLTDADVMALAAFVRWRFTDLPEWTGIDAALATQGTALKPSD
jgi:mono/diheme cytochrome c family protein